MTGNSTTTHISERIITELEVAKELDLPFIGVNLNGDRAQSNDTCPPITRDEYVVHIPFKMKIIKHALEEFPSAYAKRDKTAVYIGGRIYSDDLYKRLGLNDQALAANQPLGYVYTPQVMNIAPSAGFIFSKLNQELFSSQCNERRCRKGLASPFGDLTMACYLKRCGAQPACRQIAGGWALLLDYH